MSVRVCSRLFASVVSRARKARMTSRARRRRLSVPSRGSRSLPTVKENEKLMTDSVSRVADRDLSRFRASTTRADSFAMLASARCPRAAVPVSAFASPASDRAPAILDARRRRSRRARHPSRLGSASDADEASPDESSLASLIDSLRAAAGTANGTDLDAEGEAKVKAILQELFARDDSLADPATIDLAATNWDLIYSDSSGNSSGKLGPFVGRVSQRFRDAPRSGEYENIVRLGPLALSLAATAAPLAKDAGNESLRVTFDDLSVTVFGRRVLNKPFPPGRAGTWRMAYASDAIRVLYTNQGNVFVLTRSEAVEDD